MALASEEEKDLLLSRYQDLKWISEISGFECVRCDRVLIRHYIANCQHKFCLNCKKLVDDGSKQWRCPIEACNKAIEHAHLQDVNFERTVYELSVHCPNHKYGCPFVGQLKDIGGHLKTCKDTRERALPVIIEDSDKLNDILKQMAKFNERLNVISSSLIDAQKLILAYERKWAEVNNRLQGVSTKMETLELQTKENKSHETENHFEFEMKQFQAEIALLNKKLEESEKKKQVEEARKVYKNIIRPEVRHLRIVNEYYKEKPTFTWTVNDVKSLINGRKAQTYSNSFQIKGYPYSVAGMLTMYGKSVMFYLCYNDSKQIAMKPTPNIFVTLKDSSKNEDNKKDIVCTSHLKYNEQNMGYNALYDLQNVDRNTLKSHLYNVDDQVIFDIHVEPPEITHQTFSYDGTLVWAIDEYQIRKRMEVDGLIESYLSPYFYTNTTNGYRVLVRLKLNGCDEFEHKGVSAHIKFSDGQYDTKNPIGTYYYEVQVGVFNSIQLDQNMTKSIEIDGKNWSRIDIGCHAEIENYLYNDTMYYLVVVKDTKRKVK